jgi:type IV pilus biogenesis protein CpaD/CtpE
MRKWTPVVVLLVLAAALTIGCSQEQQAETEAPPAVEEAVDAPVEDTAEVVEEAVEEVGEAGEVVEEAVPGTE